MKETKVLLEDTIFYVQDENATRAKARAKEPTITEIKAKLDELGIEYSTNATKAELLALLPQE